MNKTELDKIQLGWRMPGEINKQIGFVSASHTVPARVPFYAQPETHLCTIARAGSGKGVSMVIPTLLNYQGSIVCMDPKGENAAVTARYRREMGQKVHILDPFGITGQEQARLDPLDCLFLAGSHFETDAEMLTELLFPGEREPRHAFWDNLARDIVSGLVIHAATSRDTARRGLGGVFSMLAEEDFETMLAVAADSAGTHPYARRAFQHFLNLGRGSSNNNVKPDTFSTARSHLAFLASEEVRKCVTGSTIALTDLIDGTPTTIYIVMPPQYLESHSRLLRLWVGTMTRALTSRSGVEVPLLLLLDEVAQLGHLPILRQMVTLYRGYGVRVWMIWQNLAQLRMHYRDWETMHDNAPNLQIFGVDNFRAARELADLLGIADPRTLVDLPRDAAAMLDGNGKLAMVRRLNYLTDPLFRGRFDPNPFHTPPGQANNVRQLPLFPPSSPSAE